MLPSPTYVKFKPAARAEVLFQRHEVRQRLARMLEVRQRIDHRHARIHRHLGNGVVRIGAQHHHIHPALHVARHIGNRLALAERRTGLIHEDRIAAHRVDARFKCQPRAQARLLKHQHHLLRVQRMPILARIQLHVVPQLHNRAHFAAREIGDRTQILACQSRSRGQNIFVLLHGNRWRPALHGCSASHGCFLLRSDVRRSQPQRVR